jgi:hypothetical protein
MNRSFAIILVLVLSISTPTVCQETTEPHQHSQQSVIDGSVNPELIPDLTAYRLYLLSVSRAPNPAAEEKKTTTRPPRRPKSTVSSWTRLLCCEIVMP